MTCEAVALEDLLGLASSCCLSSLAISAQVQKPGQVPGEHFAFCCEEGRIRKSNASMDWEPREGGREVGGAWQRLSHPGGAIGREGMARGRAEALLPQPYSPVGPLSPQPSRVEPTKGRWIEKLPA